MGLTWDDYNKQVSGTPSPTKAAEDDQPTSWDAFNKQHRSIANPKKRVDPEERKAELENTMRERPLTQKELEEWQAVGGSTIGAPAPTGKMQLKGVTTGKIGDFLPIPGLPKTGRPAIDIDTTDPRGVRFENIEDDPNFLKRMFGRGFNAVSGSIHHTSDRLGDLFDLEIARSSAQDDLQVDDETGQVQLDGRPVLNPVLQQRANEGKPLNPTGVERTGAGIGLGAAVAGGAFTPVAAELEAAREIPVIGEPVFGTISKGFEMLDKAGRFGGSKALDALPISSESKEVLREPVEEFAGMVGTLFFVKKGLEVKKGAEVKSIERLPVSDKTKQRLQTTSEVGTAVALQPLSSTYKSLVTGISEGVRTRKEKGEDITPDVSREIVSEVVKKTEVDMPAVMKVPTPEGTVRVHTNQKLVLENFMKGREDISYKRVKTLGKDTEGNPIGARFEWDFKKQQATIYTTKRTTASNLAHELGHYFDRRLSQMVDHRLSDMLPEYRNNREALHQALSGYALDKLGGEATKKQLDKKIVDIADALREDIATMSQREKRAAFSERFATAFADTINKPEVARKNAPTLADFVEHTVGPDVIRQPKPKAESPKEDTPTKAAPSEQKVQDKKAVAAEAVKDTVKSKDKRVDAAAKLPEKGEEAPPAKKPIESREVKEKEVPKTIDDAKKRDSKSEPEFLASESRGSLQIAGTDLKTGKFVEKRLSYNPDKINAPKDVEALLTQVASASKEFKSQRISKSDADIQNLAFEVGLTPEQLMKAAPGSIANAETVFAARRMVADMAFELRETLRGIDSATATKADMAKVKEQLFRLQATQKAVAGFRTEAANVFRQFKMETKAGENDIMSDLIADLKKMDLDTDDLRAFQKKTKELMEPTLADKAWHLWYASILSGPSTHIKNIVGNFSNHLAEMTRVAATKPKELPEAIAGTFEGWKVGFEQAKGVLRKGDISKFEERGLKPITFTGKAKFLNLADYVGRGLSGMDAFFREGFRGMESRSLAREQAISEGHKGELLKQRTEEIFQNQEKELSPERLEEVNLFGQRGTYTNKPEGVLGSVASAVGGVTRKHPSARLIVPFTRVVANVTNVGLDWTPAGFTRVRSTKIGGERVTKTKRQQQQQLGRAVLGTLAMTYFASLAADDRLSGSGPANWEQRKQLEATGWKANSIRIGDTWYPYQNWAGPLALNMTLVGNSFDYFKYENVDEMSAMERASVAITGTAASVLDQSFLSGVSDLFDAVASKDKRFMERFVAQQATSPVPNLLKQVARYFDPTIYESRNLGDRIMSNLRIAGPNGVRPALNIWGEERKGDALTQLQPTKVSDDPVKQFMSENSIFLTVPSRSTSLKINARETRKMTEDEYYEYIKRSGPLVKQEIEKRMSYIERLPEDARQDYINNEIVRTIRNRVKDRMVREIRVGTEIDN